jgi:REP element-mobilizing transposase RayT
MNRGADRQDIFSDDVDHRYFHRLVGDAVEHDLFEVHAHCEMTNHFHLLTRSASGGVSAALHRLQSEYARWYNERHGRSGPLFTGRFTAIPVDSDEQLLTVARYIHRNPLAIVPRSGLADYRWSSYGAYVSGVRSPDWLCTDILRTVGSMTPDEMRLFVETDLASDAAQCPWIGDRPSLDELIESVSAVFGISVASLVRRARGTARARQLVAMLAVELRIATTDEVALALGLAGNTSARVLARRGRVRSADDVAFARIAQHVRTTL